MQFARRATAWRLSAAEAAQLRQNGVAAGAVRQLPARPRHRPLALSRRTTDYEARTSGLAARADRLANQQQAKQLPVSPTQRSGGAGARPGSGQALTARRATANQTGPAALGRREARSPGGNAGTAEAAPDRSRIGGTSARTKRKEKKGMGFRERFSNVVRRWKGPLSSPIEDVGWWLSKGESIAKY